MCRSKTVHEVESSNNSSYEDGDIFIGVVNEVSDTNDEISVQLLVTQLKLNHIQGVQKKGDL